MIRPFVIALTGAGISKSAGIPTFMDTPDIKDKLSLSYRDSNPEDFARTMDNMRESVSGKKPTAAHNALAKYHVPIITMNVDSLHKDAGSRLVYEIHGSFRDDNVVLYGQSIHYYNESMDLIRSIGDTAFESSTPAYFLVIGTSLQTSFANTLISMAIQNNFYVKQIDSDADTYVPEFLEDIFKNTLFVRGG